MLPFILQSFPRLKRAENEKYKPIQYCIDLSSPSAAHPLLTIYGLCTQRQGLRAKVQKIISMAMQLIQLLQNRETGLFRDKVKENKSNTPTASQH